MSSPLVDVGILPLADLPYEEQLARREAIVRDALRRGHVQAEVSPIVPSPRRVGSRARVKLRVGPQGALGFSLPGTHTFVEVPLDELARPEVVAAAASLRGRLTTGEVEVRSDGEKVAIVLDTAVPQKGAPIEGNVFARGKVVSGYPRLRVMGLSVSPESFYQVNLEVNELVVAEVDRILQELAPARLLDLYAGVGNLSAGAVRRGVPATLVEYDRSSAGDATFNLPEAEVLVQDAGKWVPGHRFFDVALLDPPRAGAQGLLQKLVVTRPRAILYLSCDPVTLARDLRGVATSGYRVASVQPYDMFPGTDHVETLVVLVRS